MKIVTAFLTLILLFASMNAQESNTVLKLSTSLNTSSFRITNSSDLVMMRQNGDAGFYLGGNHGTGTVPATGAGVRMMWHPSKAAFRAGRVTSIQWDDANIGDYSTAIGYNTTASANYSTALGTITTANGEYSTAIGYSATASGLVSTAAGYQTEASGDYSTATGNGTEANGNYSTAMGINTTAGGNYSFAVGNNTSASGRGSVAMGSYSQSSGDGSFSVGSATVASGVASAAIGINTYAYGYNSVAVGNNAIANGDNSIAIGYLISTNGKEGSFYFGDCSANGTDFSSAENQMTMRFAGGYRLFSNSDASVGVYLPPSGNSWSSISDSTKKENIIKANGEYFLNSLAKLKLGSWNYKGQDSGKFRHYGPMAQEIFHYFGKDDYGTIGNDTTLASADIDGIIMICLQALEKRTEGQNYELKVINEEIEKRDDVIALLKKEKDEEILKLTERLNALEKLLTEKTEFEKDIRLTQNK